MIIKLKKAAAITIAFVLLVTLWSTALVLPAKAQSKTSYAASMSLTKTIPAYIENTISSLFFTFSATDKIGTTDKKLSDYITESGTAVKEIPLKDVLSTNSNWSATDDSVITLVRTGTDSVDTDTHTYRADVRGLRYNKTPTAEGVALKLNITLENSIDLSLSGRIELDNFRNPTPDKPSTIDPETGEPVKSSIIIENVILFDKNNKEIDTVTKKTEPFTVSVLYQDSGVEKEDMYNLLDESLQVFWDNDKTTGFERDKNTKGKLTSRHSSSDGIPRFRIDFDDVTYLQADSQTITFKVRYRLSDGTLLETELPVRIPQAQKPEEKKEDEKEEPKISPLRPHIVISNYSFGDNQIVAGEEFPLSLSYYNTSRDISLESVVMTITPSEDIVISSSSNTVFTPQLSAGATQSHELILKAKPNAKVGSAQVKIKFEYQYVDNINKKREEGTNEMELSIPITQIDRFSVDPITEIQDTAMIGEAFYFTVSFINRGKSPTYNISATVESSSEIVPRAEHFGNLEAGKSGDVELSVIANQPGLLSGEAIVQYEDENTNEKEIKVPFEVMIEEPYYPEDFDPGMHEEVEPEAPKMSATAIAFLIIGSVLVAAPIVFYTAKRSKQKGSEDLYEDF